MALRSVGRESEAKPVSVVLSLGTGMVPVSELKEIDVFRPDSLFDAAKLAYGISAIGELKTLDTFCIFDSLFLNSSFHTLVLKFFNLKIIYSDKYGFT